MNFFETLFGFSPDGGNGTFEILLVVINSSILAILVTLVAARAARRNRLDP